MYQVEEADVNRFTTLLRKQRYKFHWEDYWQNLYDQMGVTEYTIQKWWASKIDLIGKEVSILNSGVGFYSVPICFEKGARHVKTYDMCPITSEMAWEANEEYKPNYEHKMADVVFDSWRFSKDDHVSDVFINTSCEHCYPMKDIIPDGVEVVLSGNSLTKRGHINKIKSVEHLVEQSGITEVKFHDEITFTYSDELGIRDYKQFIVYGRKGEQ
jgi:hypothetical protein